MNTRNIMLEMLKRRAAAKSAEERYNEWEQQELEQEQWKRQNTNFGKTREEIIDNPSNRAIRDYERKYGKIGKKSFEDELLEARIKRARKGAQDKTYYSPLPLSNEAHEEENKQLNKDTPQGTIDRLNARKIDVYKDAQAVKAARPYINQENNEKAARFDELAKRYEDSAAQKLAEAQRKQNYLTSEELAKKNIYAAAEADEHIAQVYRDKAEAVRKGEYVEGADDYVPKTQEQKKKEFAAMSRAQRDDKLTKLRYNVQYWQEEKDNKDTKYAQAVIDSKIKESEDELKAYTSIAEAANENDELEQQKAWEKSLISLGSEKLRQLREVARRNLAQANTKLTVAQNAELGETGTTYDRYQKEKSVEHFQNVLQKIDDALYYADQNEKKDDYRALRQNNDFETVTLAGKSLKDEDPKKVIDKIQSGNSSSDTWVGPINIKNKAVFARNLKEKYGKLYQNSELHGDVFNELPELNVLEPYSYMTDDEVDTYSYILLKEGLEAADTYFSVIEDDIDERRREQLKKEARQYAEQDPIGATVESVFMNILSSPGALASTISNDIANIGADIKKPNDMNSVAFSNTAAVSEIRGAVQEDMSGVGRFFYGTATSAADNLAQAALFGKFMPVVMGTTAATSTYYDLKEQGIDDAKAQGVAMLSGVFELAFEKIGTAPIFDMLDNKAANFEGAWQFVKQNMLSEFQEEAATEIANIVTNAIFLGKDSEWAQRLREYKLQGMTDAEAIAQVLGEYGLQVLEAGVAGGLTGGALGGISTAINTEYVGQQMSAEDVISISLQSLVRSKNGKIAQMAQDVSDSLDGKGVTSSQANELAQLAMSSKDLETQLNGQDLSQKLMKDLSAKKEVNVDQYAVALTNSKDEAVRNLALKYTGLDLNVISEIDELARLETNSNVRQAAKLLKKTVTGKASTAFERGTAYNNLQAMMAKEQQRPQSDMPLENTAMEQSQPTDHDAQAKADELTTNLQAQLDGRPQQQKSIAQLKDEFDLTNTEKRLARKKQIGIDITTDRDIISGKADISKIDAYLQAVEDNGKSVYFEEVLDGEKFVGEETTWVKFKPASEYSEEKQQDIHDYLNAVDDEILEAAQRYREDKNAPMTRIDISPVSEAEAARLFELDGKDYSDYMHRIDKNAFNHIEKRHGKNGLADRTMADLRDVARIGYVIEHADNIELGDIGKNDELITLSNKYMDKNNTQMRMIQYSKKINGTMYVIEAVGENRYNSLWIVSAYMTKKEGLRSVADAIIPMPYVQDERPSESLFTNSIFEGEGNVNSSSVENNVDNGGKLKENLAAAADEQPSANTSKTHVSTVLFKNNISQKDTFVNNSIRTKSEKDTKHARKKKALSAEGIITAFNLSAGEVEIAKEIANYHSTTADIKRSMNAKGVIALSNFFKLHEDTMKNYERGEYELYNIKQKVSKSENLETDTEKIIESLEKNKALETINKRKETEFRAKVRENIKKTINDIANRLLKPTDKKHIPEAYTELAKHFVDLIEFDSEESQTQEGERWRKKKSKLSQTEEEDTWKINKNSLAQIIKEAKRIDIESDEFFGFDPAYAQKAEAFKEKIGKKAYLRDLSLERIKELEELIKVFKKMTVDADETHAFEAKEKISEFAEGWRNYFHHKKVANRLARNKYNYNLMDPYTYFRKLGEQGKKLAQALAHAEGKSKENIETIKNFIQKTITAKERNRLQKETVKVKLSHGEYEFTKSELMSLRALIRRKDAQSHLLNGGIARYKKGLESDLKEVIKLDKYEDAVTGDSTNDFQKIESAINDAFSEEEKDLADRMQYFLANQGAQWGNEVTMELYGYNRFQEDSDYFPMETRKGSHNSNGRDTEKNKSYDTHFYSLKNIGATKQVSGFAENTLMLRDFFDVFNEHLAQMSAYNAYVPILTDCARIFNYGTGNASETLQIAMEDKLGSAAVDFFKYSLNKLNGAGEITQKTPLDKWYGRAKAASVGFNIRVMAQQPTSYLRAATMIPAKYLAQSFVKKGDDVKIKELSKTLFQYAPIAQLKSWGRSDINTGRSIEEIVWGSSTIESKLKDAAMWGASKADDITWLALWNACLLETADKTDLEKGSEEFYRYAGERFTDVVSLTQVVDTPLHRARILDSPYGFNRLATQFMSEPIREINLWRMAVNEFEKDPATGKYKIGAAAAHSIIRTGTTIAVTKIVNAIAQSIIDALTRDQRDRDEEGNKLTYLDKFVDNFWENLAGNLNPFEQIPFLNLVYDVADGGYTSTPLYLKGFDKAKKAIDYLIAVSTGEEEFDAYDMIFAASEAISNLTGIAFSNVLREAKGFYNTFVPEEKKITDTYYKDHHTQEDTAREIVNLFMVGYEDVLKKDTPPKTMTDHDGNEITLTKEQKQNYRDSYNITYGTIANMLNDLDIWEKLPEKQRASAYEAVKRKAAQEAKYAIIGYPKDEYGDEQRTSMEEYAEDCIYYGLTKGMSKKSEKLDAIKSALELGDEDALFMYYKYGSHLSDNEALTAAREALDSLDDESERKANAKAAGLTLKEYDEYHSAINKIEGIEGEDGQTISGSAYANKLSYIIKNTDDEKTAVYLAKKFAGTSDREVLAQAEKQNVLDKKFLEMYSGFKLVEGQEDEEGKTISGTKKSKQLEYIASRCTEKQAKVLLNQIASNEDQKILIDLVSATDIDIKSFASHYSGCVTLTKSEDIEKYLLSINRQTSEVEQDILYLLTSKTKKEYNRRLDKMLKNIKGPKADEKWKARVMLYRE